MTAAPPGRVSAYGLDHSIQLLGQAQALDHLFGPLEAGEPIVLGILGASVAQNGGCLDQPRKRCMHFSGRRGSIGKGWAVRLLEHINRSWPHADHRINNSALDAMGIGALGDCLLGHLPPRLHLMIFEFGSMAQVNAADAWHMEEALRLVLQMDPPPLVLMVSFHEWCTQRLQPRRLYTTGQTLAGHLRGYVFPDTPWARVEREATRLCQHYGQACVSVKDGLEAQAYGEAPGFSVRDLTGEDCLHPVNGRRGIDLVTQLLTHWLDHARDLWAQGFGPRARARHKGLARPPALQAPLWRENERERLPGRCYTFRTSMSGRMGLQRVQWCTSSDSRAGEPGEAGRRSRWRRQEQPQSEAASCTWGQKRPQCPAAIAQDNQAYEQFMASPPSGWFFCGVSLSPSKRKSSEGVVAITPGALLRARIDVADLGHVSSSGSDDPRATSFWAQIRLTHLVSYQHMGVAELTCADGCACVAQRIDAHHIDAIRNVSIFVTHTTSAEVLDARRPCELRLRVLAASSSGGHKFKVSALFVSRAMNGTVARYRL